MQPAIGLRNESHRPDSAIAMNDAVLQVFYILFFVCIAGGSFWWHMKRSRDLLNMWADENGLRVVDSERRYMRRGPFFWTTGKGQEVFYVTVQDQSGQARNAYVRCGGFWFGLLSNNVDVRWEE